MIHFVDISHAGIQTSIVYWPAKIVDINRVVMFKLHFWDAGENALKKFDHVLPVSNVLLYIIISGLVHFIYIMYIYIYIYIYNYNKIQYMVYNKVQYVSLTYNNYNNVYCICLLDIHLGAALLLVILCLL